MYKIACILYIYPRGVVLWSEHDGSLCVSLANPVAGLRAVQLAPVVDGGLPRN